MQWLDMGIRWGGVLQTREVPCVFLRATVVIFAYCGYLWLSFLVGTWDCNLGTNRDACLVVVHKLVKKGLQFVV
jgi:hypothetical protein